MGSSVDAQRELAAAAGRRAVAARRCRAGRRSRSSFTHVLLRAQPSCGAHGDRRPRRLPHRRRGAAARAPPRRPLPRAARKFETARAAAQPEPRARGRRRRALRPDGHRRAGDELSRFCGGGHRGLLMGSSHRVEGGGRRLVERRSVVRCICSAEPDARSLIAAQVSERFVHPCVHGAGSHVQAASGGADGEEEDESGAVVLR